MTNKTLPPELVEKMRLEICNVGDWQVQLYSKQCAQIAVDYADDVNSDTFISLYKSQEALGKQMEQNQLLRKQRDELIYGLTKLKEENMLSHAGDEIIEQLLKKH